MWVLIVLTFGFVATDKVILEEFTSKERCETAKQLILKMDGQWKRSNVRPGDVRENPNFAPMVECAPK